MELLLALFSIKLNKLDKNVKFNLEQGLYSEETVLVMLENFNSRKNNRKKGVKRAIITTTLIAAFLNILTLYSFYDKGLDNFVLYITLATSIIVMIVALLTCFYVYYLDIIYYERQLEKAMSEHYADLRIDYLTN